MFYPKTKEEWWFLLEENKHDIRNLLVQFHPCTQNQDQQKYKITAGVAEKYRQVVWQEIKQKDIDPVSVFDTAVDERDAFTLLGLLGETWFGIPESVEFRTFLGFDVLCDLLSESYVLGDVENDRENGAVLE